MSAKLQLQRWQAAQQAAAASAAAPAAPAEAATSGPPSLERLASLLSRNASTPERCASLERRLWALVHARSQSRGRL